jgi:DNA modification methylase
MNEINYLNTSDSCVAPVSISIHKSSKFIKDIDIIKTNCSNILSPLLNQIFNEDCIDGMKRIPDGTIDAIITDPPYGIAKKNPLKGSSHGKVQTISSEWDIFGSINEFQKFTSIWLKECHRVLKSNGSIAIWGDRRNIFFIQPLIEKLFPKFLDLFTWIKRDAPPNITRRGLAASTEFCLIYSKSETGWTFNHDDIKKYNNGKQMRNYIDIQRTMPANERTEHPTQKKIETQLLLVEMLSNKDNIVLDPFVGSGTTAVASKQLDRNYICFEKNKKYFEIALDRLRK